MWLLLIDSFSKWPEVLEMTTAPISKLKQIFTAQGLPEQIVSENGLQFTASEFNDYCSLCGILYTTTAPYHPRSNAEVVRLVETFKNSVEKANRTSRKEIQDRVMNFLARYIVTPHSVTDQTPSELLNG